MNYKKRKFFEMIVQSSVSDRVLAYYDISEEALDIPPMESDFDAMSHGEEIMCKFFANVWLGRDRYDIGIINISSTLDSGNKEIITTWLTEPFYP